MKLFVTEQGWELADALWRDADELFTCRVTSVETQAALARARRSGRLSAEELDRARADFRERWPRLAVVELDEELAALAGEAAESHRLRALDAMHLAAALSLGDSELVVASWDGDLRRGVAEAGLAVAPAF